MSKYKINYTELQSCIEKLRNLTVDFPQKTMDSLGESSGDGNTQSAINDTIKMAAESQEQLFLLIQNTIAFLDTLMAENKQIDVNNANAIHTVC